MTSEPKAQLLNERQAADYLSLAPRTLAKWRTSRRRLLPYFKYARVIRYSKADLDRFIAAGRVDPTNLVKPRPGRRRA